jgi:hypothetical protein
VDEIQRKDARMINPENNLIFFASFASLHCYPSESSKTARILDCAAATPLFDCGQSFQSGVALRFPPQSKKIWLRLCRAAPLR